MIEWEISHPALSHPLHVEDPTGRKSEAVIRWAVVHHLETNWSGLGWDWVEEMKNFSICYKTDKKKEGRDGSV